MMIMGQGSKLSNRQSIKHIITGLFLSDEEKIKLIEQRVQDNPDIIHKKYKHDKSAMHLAVEFHHYEIIKYLIDLQFPVDTYDQKKCTPLHSAARINSPEALVILTYNVPSTLLNALDENHETALHHAVRSKSVDCVKLLVSKGIDTQLKNNKNQIAEELITGNMMEQENLYSALTHPPYKVTSEMRAELFPSTEPTIDDALTGTLSKQFKHLSIKPRKTVKYGYTDADVLDFTTPTFRTDNRESNSHPKQTRTIKEKHFLENDCSTILKFLRKGGDPNLIIPPYSKPLIYYAFKYKLQNVFIQLMLAGARLNNHELINHFKRDCFNDKDHLNFLHSVHTEIGTKTTNENLVFQSRIRALSKKIQEQLLNMRMNRVYSTKDINKIPRSVLRHIINKFPNNKDVVSYIYILLSGKLKDDLRMFDASYLETCLMGLLHKTTPDIFLKCLRDMMPHFSKAQKLMGAFALMKLMIFNTHFGYEVSSEFKGTLSSLLEANYPEALRNPLMEVYELTESYHKHSYTCAYHDLSMVLAQFPSYHHASIYDKIGKINKKNVASLAKSLVGELNKITNDYLCFFELKFIQQLSEPNKSSDKDVSQKHFDHYPKLLNALTEFVDKTIQCAADSKHETLLMAMFVKAANICLTSTNQCQQNLNAFVAIMAGLIRHETSSMDKKTKKVFDELQLVCNNHSNHKQLRDMSKIHQRAFPLLALLSTDIIHACELNNDVLFDIGSLYTKIIWAQECVRLQKSIPPSTDLLDQLNNIVQAQAFIQQSYDSLLESEWNSLGLSRERGDNSDNKVLLFSDHSQSTSEDKSKERMSISRLSDQPSKPSV